MTTAEVVRCPDGHFHCAIYGLGPYIADYIEQVWLAGIVQGWCPKYVFSYCTSVNAMALIINLDVMLHWKTWMFLMPTIVLMKRLIFLSIVSILMLSGVNLVYKVMLWYGHIYCLLISDSNCCSYLLMDFLVPIFMNSCHQIYSTS